MKLYLLLALALTSFASFAGGIEEVIKPVFPYTKFRYTAPSGDARASEHGICKTLGFEKAVPGGYSSSNDIDWHIIVNEKGRPVKAEGDWLPTVDKIFCVNRLTKKPKKILAMIEAPVEPGTNVPYGILSSADGICKRLGYSKSLERGALTAYFGKQVSTTFHANEDGSLSSEGESYPIVRAHCFVSADDQVERMGLDDMGLEIHPKKN